MNLPEWQSRLQQKEDLKADIELQIECTASDAMRRTYEKQLEKVNQEIDCCITAIEQVKKREKFMARQDKNRPTIIERKLGKIS